MNSNQIFDNAFEANRDCPTFLLDNIGADENSVQAPTPIDSSPKQDPPLVVRRRVSKAKRNRTIFTADQLVELEKEYKDNNYLDRAKRIHLARKLSLTERQIKVWFQNKRMKHKKDGTLKQNVVRERRQQRVQLQLQENERPLGQLLHLLPHQQPKQQLQELLHLLPRQQPYLLSRQQSQQQPQQQPQQLPQQQPHLLPGQQPQQQSHLLPRQQPQQQTQHPPHLFSCQQPQHKPQQQRVQQPVQQSQQQPLQQPLQQPQELPHQNPQFNHQQTFGTFADSLQCTEQLGQLNGQQYGNLYLQDTNEHQFDSSCMFSGNATLQDPICRESANLMDSGLFAETGSLGLQDFAPTPLTDLGEIISDLEDVYRL